MNALWKRLRAYWRNYVPVPLGSRAARQDPYPFYKELREVAPVHCVEKRRTWTVSRYKDVQQVLRCPDVYGSSGIAGNEPTLLGNDGSDHARVRKIVSRLFDPRHIASFEEPIRRLAHEHLDEMAARRQCEFMRDLAIPLPIKVMAILLDLDPCRSDDYYRWSQAFITDRVESLSADEESTRQDDLREMRAFVVEYVKRCRRSPEGGVLASEVIPFLTDEEARSLVELLFVAGQVTTRFLLGNIAVSLLREPNLMAALRADRSVIPAAVEEVLRISSPVLFVLRRADRDVTLAGQQVPGNAILRVLLGSANRTETKFTDADRFSLQRDSQGHLAFGTGPHFCLGASLARLEGKIVLETLLERLEVFEAREPLDQIEWDETNQHTRGPEQLKVNVRALE
jgi:cytochrome P450